MARSGSKTGSKKRGGTRRPPDEAKLPQLDPPLDLRRAGMPDADAITGVDEVKKGGSVYRIIHTDYIDEYEKPQKAEKPPARKRRSKK